MTIPLRARDLGARGSRSEVGEPDPAGAVPQDAAAVLAAVPGWWACLASEAGLSGRWLDVSAAVDSPPPEAALSAEPEPHIGAGTAPEALGAASVAALSPQVRARHGRHYTPADLTRRRAERTAIMSLNGHAENVAQVKSPRGSGPWLLPRRVDDAPAAAAAANFTLRLADVGYRCSTGPLVWNRRKPDLTSCRVPGSVPILWDMGCRHRRRHATP